MNQTFQNLMLPSENVEMNQLGMSRTLFICQLMHQPELVVLRDLASLTNLSFILFAGFTGVERERENNCKVLVCALFL